MAIINGNTFNIYSDSEEPKTLKNSFECDDLIAPIIRTLNLKGYTTTFCCAGHPYIEENKARVYSDTCPSNNIIEGTYYIRKSTNTNSYIVHFADYLSLRSYISFKEGCIPETIPESWEYCSEINCISKEYLADYSNPFTFFREQLECMEELQKWADSLMPKE